MISTWLPLIGVLVFLGIVCCWRPWLQSRRYGGSGIRFLRSGPWPQRLRDALGVVFAVCLVGQAIAAAGWPESPSRVRVFYGLDAGIWPVTGVLFVLGGLILLIVAQLHLGASWRIGIDEGTKPGLVTNGSYRFCRNPIFLAILITLTGYTVLLPTRLSLALLLGAFIGIRQQILTEEAYLVRAYGESYLEYARRVGRFVPTIGRLR